MKQKEELPNYIELSEKLYELVKGENYDDVEKAAVLLISNLKRRSIVN
ncbi:hypothetical protein FPKKA176_contig00130-0003 [Flavobacterium psychrophilum]|nr:hypothetical protein FPK15_contig00136-0002 [Flavobacterium psychrophilum]GAW90804.1 hypothetical protein FPS14_contig00127-0002 [Flavobacterium psychrophilum]GEJ34739.1 hypothetical protein FPN181_contig00119-0002 [Flavobacterium psychrophilum]GEJ35376.1 hypothetical protein FPN185_contig00134-0002 [Flavobacterium psychrophilum]GEJ38523.1 hypothetical protein FPN186_contig00019-0002 [Flavobacterium psychrophilum]